MCKIDLTLIFLASREEEQSDDLMENMHPQSLVSLAKMATVPTNSAFKKIVARFAFFLACVTFCDAAELEFAGNGSGFFVTKDGYFITNEHVVHDAAALRIRCNEKIYEARVLKTDANNDIAVLKVDRENGEFDCLALGGDLEVRPGEDVFTIGFPMATELGFAPKTTTGSISALSGLHDDARVFQTSTQIQPGNSGGPLVLKATGNVVGITSSTLNTAAQIAGGRPVPQNVNYAMKTTYIRPLLSAIPGLTAKLTAPGKETRPWLEVQSAVEQSVGLVMVFQANKEVPEPEVVAKPQPGPAPQPQPRGPWIFPNSSQEYLSEIDLEELNADALWQARNEIFARNGLIFSTPRGQKFTASLGNVYHGNEKDQARVFARMNAIEKANVEFIKKHEK